jgi:hypothetical protein
MQKTAVNNLVLTESSSLKQLAELLKKLLTPDLPAACYVRTPPACLRKRSTGELGTGLAVSAEHAYTLRRTGSLEQVSRILLNLSLAAVLSPIYKTAAATLILLALQQTCGRNDGSGTFEGARYDARPAPAGARPRWRKTRAKINLGRCCASRSVATFATFRARPGPATALHL